MLISLSTTMLNKEDVLKFFKGIKTEELEYQKEEDKRMQEQKNIKRVLIITILVILIVALLPIFTSSTIHVWGPI